MKKFFLALLLLASGHVFAEYSFTIQPRSYLFSSHFDIYSNNNYLYTVESNFFQLRTCYSVCNHSGEVVAGAARLLSLGALSNALREIDVTDFRGKKIGFIEGRWWTTASRKYFFYDNENWHYATAYIGLDGNSVSIVNAQNERVQIALLRRFQVSDGGYYWETRVFQNDAIDPSMLYVFSAFIADTCSFSKRDSANAVGQAIQTGILLDYLYNDD